MLAVQEFLRSNNMDFELLKSKFGIDYTMHESDNRVILNYSQINSPKNVPEVDESRGLVLDKVNGDVIAKSFNRFYNWGEIPDKDNKFSFNGCSATHKEDGSLILLYHYNGKWCMNTRGSFGNGEVCEGMSWKKLFNIALPVSAYKELDTSFTYVFELCSRYNKVVRDYPQPKVFLLGVVNPQFNVEMPDTIVDMWAQILKVDRPSYVTIKDIHDATIYIQGLAKNDKTFEGLVLKDHNGNRIKVKSVDYVSLHRLANNHKLTLARICEIIRLGEEDEFCLYFPELSEQINKVKSIEVVMHREFYELYDSAKHLTSQKDFAMMVKDSPYAPLCFQLRKFGKFGDDTWFNALERKYDNFDLCVDQN